MLRILRFHVYDADAHRCTRTEHRKSRTLTASPLPILLDSLAFVKPILSTGLLSTEVYRKKMSPRTRL